MGIKLNIYSSQPSSKKIYFFKDDRMSKFEETLESLLDIYNINKQADTKTNILLNLI